MTSRLLLCALGGLALLPSGALSPGVDELGELKVELRSGDKWVRKSAVEKLARLGGPEAWELVVGALGDPKGEVADTAELFLGELADEGALAALLGREGLGSRDTWVRLRVAEVLGRLPGAVEEDGLVHALKDGEPEVRRMAAWSVERRAAGSSGASGGSGVSGSRGSADGRLVEAVARLAERDRDDGVRARALFALAALDPGLAREPVRACVRAREAELRCAAAALLPRVLDRESAQRLLESLSADASLAVRTSAARSLAELGTRRSVQALVGRLEAEEEERLGLRLVEELRALSGLKHRRDARPWRDWADRLPEDWHGETAAPREGDALSGNRSVALAGLPILSGRIAFLIDLSGSIWKERADGTTKKEIVDGKLREVFERLPETTLFNVIPYTGEPHPWQEKVVPATRRNVQAAARFFERCREQGTGNFWDAAMLALADPEVDTLLVLTDGAPTGGRRYQLDLIVPLFLERNATRQVALDSILVDAPKRLQRYWTELAEGTGGRSIAVEL